MERGPGTVIAGCVALSAFAVAIVAGLSSGNPATTVLLRAVVVLLIGWVAGLVIGAVVMRVVDAHEPSGTDGAAPSENAAADEHASVETAEPNAAELGADEQEALAI